MSGITTRQVHLSRFSVSFARDFCFDHSCTDRDFRAFHGVKLHFVPDFDDDVSIFILCPATNALCAFQPGQFRFLLGILFDVACWTAGLKQLMHMSHFFSSLTACLVLMRFEFVRMKQAVVGFSCQASFVPVCIPVSDAGASFNLDSSGVSMVFSCSSAILWGSPQP